MDKNYREQKDKEQIDELNTHLINSMRGDMSMDEYAKKLNERRIDDRLPQPMSNPHEEYHKAIVRKQQTINHFRTRRIVMDNTELRPCEFDEQHVKGAGRHQVESWRKGYFHAWTGLSEWPKAIVERASDGTIAIVESEGIRFPREVE